MPQPQTLDLLSEIPCYKCIILEPTRAYPENCNPNQCQRLTDWLMQETRKRQQQQEQQAATATPSTQQ